MKTGRLQNFRGWLSGICALGLVGGCSLIPSDRMTADVEISSSCVPSGPYALVNYRGEKQVEGFFEDGVRAGAWRYWDSGGVRIAELNYRGGLREGPYRLWYGSFADPSAAGRKKVVGAFAGDQLEGRHASWDSAGQPICVAELRRGEVVSAECWKASGRKATRAQSMTSARGLCASDIDFLHRLDRIVDESLRDLCGARRSDRPLAGELLRE